VKKEPKVGQTWKHEMWDNHYKIVAINGNWIWAEVDGGKPTTFHLCYLNTMILDEHGNKPTEDNDDVAFYDVMEDEDIGPVLNVQLAGRNPCSIVNVLYREDLHGRTCVGFLYKGTLGDCYFDTEAIGFRFRVGFTVGDEREMQKTLSNAEFRIPVKAVFKRLEARS